MGFLNEGAQAVPNILRAVDPDLAHAAPPAFGAGMMPQAAPALNIDVPEAPIDVSGMSGAPLASMAGSVSEPRNFLERLGVSGKRHSILDIIGGIADVGAKIGQVEPLYQSGLDAAHNRERQNTQDDWQQKFNAQKLTRGGQELEAGQGALDDRGVEKLGQATRGLAAVFAKGGAPAVMQAWPVIAQQLGIDPAKAALFSQQLEADPAGTIESLNAALNAPSSNSSLPGSIQEFNLLKNITPEQMAALPPAAQERLHAMAGGMTDAQAAAIGLNRDKFNFDRGYKERVRADRRYEYDNKPPPGAAGNALKAEQAAAARQSAATAAETVVSDMRDAFNRLKAAGGINSKGQSSGQRAGAWALENVPVLERMTNPEGFSARQDLDRLRTQGISSLLPLLGGITLGGKNIDAAKELDTWRKAIASASDYESAMRALDGFQRTIDRIKADQPAAAPAARRTPRAGTPAPAAGGWKVIGVK